LIPALIQTHRHGADEGFDSSGGLIVGGPESSADILVIKDLYFEGKIFLELNLRCITFLMIMTRKGSLIPRV
jgi:hypothetical protein